MNILKCPYMQVIGRDAIASVTSVIMLGQETVLASSGKETQAL